MMLRNASNITLPFHAGAAATKNNDKNGGENEVSRNRLTGPHRDEPLRPEREMRSCQKIWSHTVKCSYSEKVGSMNLLVLALDLNISQVNTITDALAVAAISSGE